MFQLPANLRQIQLDGIARAQPRGTCQTFLRTRYFLCQACALQQKVCRPQKLRLDTIQHALVCSTCCSNEILSIDMVGRVLRHKRQSFILCPVCVRIQPYTGQADLSTWFQGTCQHNAPTRSQRQTTGRTLCTTCKEPANQHRIERVDHLTGETRRFAFCQRHMLRHDELAQCFNARQLLNRFGPIE